MSPLPPQLQAALIDPTAQFAPVGRRPSSARLIVRLISSATMYSALGAGIFLGGTHMAELSGIAGEIQARMNPMHALVPSTSKISWPSMEVSPFMQAGFDPSGQFSVDRLMAAYKAAGLSASQAADIANHLPALSPVLMGTDDPVLVKSLQLDAHLAAQSLARDYPEQAKRLVAMQDTTFIAPQSSIDALENWDEDQRWSRVRERILASGSDPLPQEHQLVFSDMSMEEATSALEEAVENTGLRALRLPPAAWSSPQKLFDLAQGLQYANIDLQEATQWPDQVLGLGGRVILTIGDPPSHTGAAGLATASSDGRVQVWAQWNNLSHEWFHAVDFVAAQQSFQAAGVQSITQQLQPLRMKKHPSVVEAWKLAVEGVLVNTPQWQQARTDYATTLDQVWSEQSKDAPSTYAASLRPSQYFNSTVEQGAYAFQATQGAKPGSVFQLTAADYENPAVPGRGEAAALEPVWAALFASMAPLSLSTPAKPLTLQDRMLARRQAHVAPPASPAPRSSP